MSLAGRILRGAILAAAATSLVACGEFPADCKQYCSSGDAGYHFDPRPWNQAETGVTVLPTAGGFAATRVVTISNPFEWATRGAFGLQTQAGTVSSVASSSAGYELRIALSATAPTEAGARAALATLVTDHADEIGANAVHVSHTVHFEGDDAEGVERRADMVLGLPAELPYSLSQHTGTGSASSSGLHGSGIRLETSVGDVSLSGVWDYAEARSGTGTLTIDGDVTELIGYVDSGNVNAALPGTRSVQATLSSNTGDVDVTLGRTVATTFDLVGSTYVGAVSITVADTEPVGTQTPTQRHHRSPAYDGASVQVQVDANTMVGDVSVHE